MLSVEHKLGLALCVAALILIGISDRFETTPEDLRLTERARVTERKTYNQLFILEKNCTSEVCRESVKAGLEKENCKYLADLRNLRIIESVCRSSVSGMTPEQLGARAAANIDGIEKHMPNSFVRNPAHEEARDESKTMPARVIGYRHKNRSMSSPNGVRQVILDSVTRIEQVTEEWNLDRLDSLQGLVQNALDNKYSTTCFPKDGLGATVYVIDTGCRADHDELIGRTTQHSVRFNSAEDDNGHGSHVASIAAGTIYGVCKKCQIVCIKALDSEGVGTMSDVLDAMNWIVDTHREKADDLPGVAVLSLAARIDIGTTQSEAFKTGIDAMVSVGVVPVVAAGNNDKADACLYSPAQVESAVTVGGTNIEDKPYTRGNLGKCVDVVAPGEMINSAWFTSKSAIKERSGTSQAAPHVAGAIAMMLAERRMPQAEVMHLLTSKSKKLEYSLGGKNFETSYLRILKDDCSEYNFPSVKQLPSIQTFSPSTTKTTAQPTTTTTATTRPNTTTTTTSRQATTTTKTTTTLRMTTTTRAPPTTIAKTTQKKVSNVPSDRNLSVNAQNAFPVDAKTCACYHNVFSITATSLCPRRKSVPGTPEADVKCEKEMCTPKWECVKDQSIQSEETCVEVTKPMSSYVCDKKAESSDTDCSCKKQTSVITFMVPSSSNA